MKVLAAILLLGSSLLAQSVVPVSGSQALAGVQPITPSLQVVQGRANFNPGTAQTSISASIASTNGNLLVAFVREGSNSSDNFTVTDNLGQTWTTAGYNSFGGTNRSGFFYKPNSGAVSTVTANFTTGGGVTRPGILVYEISGAAAATDPLDSGPVFSSTSSTVTSLASGSLNTNNSTDTLLIGLDVSADQSGTNNGFVPPSAYSFPGSGVATNTRQALMYQIVGSTQTGTTATPSWGTASQAAVSFLAFRTPNTGPAALQAISLNPNSVLGGNSSTGTATLSNTAPPGGITVALSSNSVSAQVGASVTIPAGSTAANFPITTSTVGSSVSATITGSYSSVSKTANLTINSVNPPSWFASNSFLNTPVPSCAHAGTCIATNSASWVNGSLINTGGCPGGGNTCEHLSIGGFGVGVLIATASNSTVKTFNCTNYNTNSCNVGGTIQFPVPNAATAGSIPGGTDHSVAFLYTTNDSSGFYGKELDCWETSFSNGQWSCDPSLIQNFPDGVNDGIQNQAVKNNGWGTCAPYANKPTLNANGTFATGTNYSCTGATASGIAFAGGLLRAKEVANCTSEATCATAVQHSLQFQATNLLNTTHYACPATHQDTAPNHGAGTGAPQGTRFFLPSSYNIAANDVGWSNLEKAVAYALQNYGAYVQDFTGGGSQIQGETSANDAINGNTVTWSSIGVSDGQSLSHIPWSQMRFISGAYCDGSGTY